MKVRASTSALYRDVYSAAQWLFCSQDSASCLKSLGRNLQQLSSGSTHLVGAMGESPQRELVVKECTLPSVLLVAAIKPKKVSHAGNVATLPGSPQAASLINKQPMGIDVDSDSSNDIEEGDISAWNWREDDKYDHSVLSSRQHPSFFIPLIQVLHADVTGARYWLKGSSYCPVPYQPVWGLGWEHCRSFGWVF